jgi:hypothetical protein
LLAREVAGPLHPLAGAGRRYDGALDLRHTEQLDAQRRKKPWPDARLLFEQKHPLLG